MQRSEPRIGVDRIAPRVMRITIDRPPVNAADAALHDELYEALMSVRDTEMDVLMLTGAGDIFCAGNDIYEFAEMDSVKAESLMASVRRAFWALYDCPVPVVARVNGPAFGTGLALAALSDIVIASERAMFGLPELDVGVLGGMKFGRRFLPELAVRRMFFTGERISATDFAAMGAPITVVPHEQLDDAVDAVLATVVSKGGVALRFAKQAMNAVEHLDTKTGYEYEQTFTVRMADRPESKAAAREVIQRIADRRTTAR
jgi:enoyl-CoA hydratase/carnithine racemase